MVQQILGAKNYALLLNDRPPPGLEGAFMDAVTTDDFSAGVCAARALKRRSTLERASVCGRHRAGE